MCPHNWVSFPARISWDGGAPRFHGYTWVCPVSIITAHDESFSTTIKPPSIESFLAHRPHRIHRLLDFPGDFPPKNWWTPMKHGPTWTNSQRVAWGGAHQCPPVPEALLQFQGLHRVLQRQRAVVTTSGCVMTMLLALERTCNEPATNLHPICNRSATWKGLNGLNVLMA